jgi:hypothetical protein
MEHTFCHTGTNLMQNFSNQPCSYVASLTKYINMHVGLDSVKFSNRYIRSNMYTVRKIITFVLENPLFDLFLDINLKTVI